MTIYEPDDYKKINNISPYSLNHDGYIYKILGGTVFKECRDEHNKHLLYYLV
jgi:hypothetical protein